MKRIIRYWAIAAALAGVVPAAWTLAESPRSSESSPSFKEEQVVVMKESGKPDRRCVIISSKKLPDGVTAYQVKALDNGEVMTINDRVPSATPAAAPPQTPYSPPAQSEGDGIYKEKQVIAVREPGKPDRRCTIMTAKKELDGLVTYTVKALDNGEILTIRNRPTTEPAQRAAVQPPAESKTAGMNANAGRVDSLTPNSADKLGTDLPRAKEWWDDPLNPPTPSAADKAKKVKAPIAQPVKMPAADPSVATANASTNSQETPGTVPAKPSRFRLFGKSPTAAPAPNTTSSTTDAPGRAMVQQPAGRAMVSTVEPPLGYPSPASVGRSSLDPMPLGFGPQAPLGVPMARDPLPLPLNTAPFADPSALTNAREQTRFAEKKDSLLTAERPSQRIAIAEDLAFGPRGTTPEVRAALMLSAQDDPAGCVRAACIRCLSKQDVRDRAFMALVLAGQNDKDPDVREESVMALQKATRK